MHPLDLGYKHRCLIAKWNIRVKRNSLSDDWTVYLFIQLQVESTIVVEFCQILDFVKWISGPQRVDKISELLYFYIEFCKVMKLIPGKLSVKLKIRLRDKWNSKLKVKLDRWSYGFCFEENILIVKVFIPCFPVFLQSSF